MSLIDELKEKRAEAVAALETQMEFVRAHKFNVSEWHKVIEDLDTAIAALAPSEALLDPVPSPSHESSSQETVTEAAPEDLPAMSDAEFEALPEFEDNEPEEVISVLTGDPAIEPESGLHGDPVETPPAVSELDSQVTPQDATEQSQENPIAQMLGKALAAESEAKEQRKYNPFAIFGAKVDA